MLHPIWRQRNMALGDAARTKQRDRVSAIREIPDRPELAGLRPSNLNASGLIVDGRSPNDPDPTADVLDSGRTSPGKQPLGKRERAAPAYGPHRLLMAALAAVTVADTAVTPERAFTPSCSVP